MSIFFRPVCERHLGPFSALAYNPEYLMDAVCVVRAVRERHPHTSPHVGQGHMTPWGGWWGANAVTMSPGCCQVAFRCCTRLMGALHHRATSPSLGRCHSRAPMFTLFLFLSSPAPMGHWTTYTGEGGIRGKISSVGKVAKISPGEI